MDTWVIVLIVLALLGVLGVELLIRARRKIIERKQAYLWDATQQAIREKISDPDRLLSVTRVRERTVAQQAFLDQICRSTAVALKSPRSVITLIDSETQEFIAHHAVDEREGPIYDLELPLQSTYCQFTVAADRTLVIQNAAFDPLVKDNPCTTELGMRAYLGTPVHSQEGFAVGSLCVFDFEPRRWERRDIATIESFAALVCL